MMTSLLTMPFRFVIGLAMVCLILPLTLIYTIFLPKTGAEDIKFLFIDFYKFVVKDLEE